MESATLTLLLTGGFTGFCAGFFTLDQISERLTGCSENLAVIAKVGLISLAGLLLSSGAYALATAGVEQNFLTLATGVGVGILAGGLVYPSRHE